MKKNSRGSVFLGSLKFGNLLQKIEGLSPAYEPVGIDDLLVRMFGPQIIPIYIEYKIRSELRNAIDGAGATPTYCGGYRKLNLMRRHYVSVNGSVLSVEETVRKNDPTCVREREKRIRELMKKFEKKDPQIAKGKEYQPPESMYWPYEPFLPELWSFDFFPIVPDGSSYDPGSFVLTGGGGERCNDPDSSHQDCKTYEEEENWSPPCDMNSTDNSDRDGCETVACDDSDEDGVEKCMSRNGFGQCVECDNASWDNEDEGAYPLPPWMDDDVSMSEEDAAKAWSRLLMEQDMAKRKTGPGGPAPSGIPDDFLDKEWSPLIRPTGAGVSSEVMRQVMNPLNRFGYSDLYHDKGVEEASPLGPDPRPTGEGRNDTNSIDIRNHNPYGPRVATTRQSMSVSSINYNPDSF